MSTWRHRSTFLRCGISLIKFKCWSKFYVNIILGSRVLTIFLYKGLTRNWRSEIHLSKFSPISQKWGKLWIPNMARMSLMSLYSRVTAFTVSQFLKENQQGEGVVTTTQIRVKLRMFHLGQKSLNLVSWVHSWYGFFFYSNCRLQEHSRIIVFGKLCLKLCWWRFKSTHSLASS